MSIPSIRKLIVGAVCMLTTAVAQANVVNVSFTYSGSTLLNMAGSFSYDSATAGSSVDKSELLTFKFDVFTKLDPTTSLFGYKLNTLSRDDNFFSFDAINERLATTPGSQRWGMGSFLFQITNPRSGVKGQGLILNSSDSDYVLPGDLANSFEYKVTSVPEPEAYGMLLLGLGLIGAVARRKTA